MMRGVQPGYAPNGTAESDTGGGTGLMSARTSGSNTGAPMSNAEIMDMVNNETLQGAPANAASKAWLYNKLVSANAKMMRARSGYEDTSQAYDNTDGTGEDSPEPPKTAYYDKRNHEWVYPNGLRRSVMPETPPPPTRIADDPPVNHGAVDPATGEFFAPAAGGGYTSTRDGTFYAPAGPNGVTDTRTGEFIPVQ